MDIRRIVLSAVLVSLVLGLAGPVIAQGESGRRYEQVITFGPLKDSVRILGLMMLALAHERENIEPQLEDYAWYKHPDVELTESAKELEAVAFYRQIAVVAQVVEKYDIRELGVAGFTCVGLPDNLDLYYAGRTAHGPVIIRISICLFEDGPRLFGMEVFEGWQASREAIAAIDYRAGDRMVSITYTPADEMEQADEVDETNEADEADETNEADEVDEVDDLESDEVDDADEVDDVDAEDEVEETDDVDGADDAEQEDLPADAGS